MEIGNSTSEVVERLTNYLSEFSRLSADIELRPKIQALLPIYLYTGVLALGDNLFPREIVSRPWSRLLHFFLLNPYTAIPREELSIVAGVEDWERHVRDLQRKFGWAIVRGVTAKQLANEGEFPLKEIDFETLRSDDFILVSTEQDRSSAFRWYIAKRIRKKNISVQNAILKYLQRSVGYPVFAEELSFATKDNPEWARRTRELRTRKGWPIVTMHSGRPDLPIGTYLLEGVKQSPLHDRKIDDNLRRSVLIRDLYTCRKCGWSQDLYNRLNPRHLELHHINHEIASQENLITLCNLCHVAWHTTIREYEAARFYDWMKSPKLE